jgi:hypothetical protein
MATDDIQAGKLTKVVLCVVDMLCTVFCLSNILSISVAGKLNLELKRYKEAELYYKDLLMRNPENTTYYARLQEAQQLTTASEKLKMFSEFQELFPRALAPRRLPLTYATGGFCEGFVDYSQEFFFF